MHGCALLDTYSHDMPMKCMLMPKEAFFPFFYNVVIVKNLLLYTRKCEVNDENSLPFVP